MVPRLSSRGFMNPRVFTEGPSNRSEAESLFATPTSRAVIVAGVAYLLGSVVDLGILWIGQRQPGLQWEFVAITNTIEAWPRMILALGLIYLGLHISRSRSQTMQRLLAGSLLVLGLGALVLGVLMTLNYLQVSGNLEGDGLSLVRTAVLKTLLLCTLFVTTLIPVGALGVRGRSDQP